MKYFNVEKHFSSSKLFVVIFFFILFNSSCASFGPSKPNAPYSGDLTDNFIKLEQWNPLLGKEIRKLPEIQDGVLDYEAQAIDTLVDLFDKAPDAFNRAFEQMYQVGKPDVRKYCSPLQAMFWLAQQDRLDAFDKSIGILDAVIRRKDFKYTVDPNYPKRKIIYPFTLENLLNVAWGNEPLLLSNDEIDLIVDSLKKESDRKSYATMKKYSNDVKLQKYIFGDYEKNPRMFSREAREIIKNAKNNSKWEDFNTVVERLNSPKLLNFYQRSNFNYWTDRGSRLGNSRLIFKKKKGDCRDYTAFSVSCLEKAGYEAWAIKVVSSTGRAFHVVCEYKDNGKEYIMDNSCPSCGGEGITEKEIYVRRYPQVGFGSLHD